MGQKQGTSTPLPATATVADAELVRSCRSGDMTAWRSLYDRYAPLIHRFSAALGVPAEEREDAVQDILIAVFRSLRHFRGEAQLSTWIYRIAASARDPPRPKAARARNDAGDDAQRTPRTRD